MMQFKVGDVVECVNFVGASGAILRSCGYERTYTVSEIEPYEAPGMSLLAFEEVEGRFSADRFVLSFKR